MMWFVKKIEIEISGGSGFYSTSWAKHYKEGTVMHDTSGKRWEVMKDIHFEKYWWRETVIEK